MKKTALLAMGLIFSLGALAQETESKNSKKKTLLQVQPMVVPNTPVLDQKGDVYSVVEKMPAYPGGMQEMMAFLGDNIKYPEWEKKENIQGVVYASFIVDKDGSIIEPTILKSVDGSKNFDAETLRVINLMPKWIPGEQRGEAVKVRFNLPVRYKL